MASNLEPKINRIATAVTSALSALTAKGVTVPEGANVESLAALIESIEAGGGGGSVKLAHGTLTFASDTTIAGAGGQYYVTHNLGVTPNFALIFAEDFSTKDDFICSYFDSIGISEYTDSGRTFMVSVVNGYNIQYQQRSVSQYTATAGTTDKLYIRGVNSDTKIRANVEVHWICGYLGE